LRLQISQQTGEEVLVFLVDELGHPVWMEDMED
jgi:hypothetical protein